MHKMLGKATLHNRDKQLSGPSGYFLKEVGQSKGTSEMTMQRIVNVMNQLKNNLLRLPPRSPQTEA